MRLNAQERNSILQIAKKHFGENVQVILFGSRVDDGRKGGDIDLLIVPLKNSERSAKDTFGKKMAMSVDLEMTIGHRNIDLLVEYPNDDRTILKTAREKGITLC